jgi:hypothetical protein
MIPSSIKLFVLLTLSFSNFIFAMQKPPAIPSSQSMSFPIPKKEPSSENKNKGSLIKKMGRSISALLDRNPKIADETISSVPQAQSAGTDSQKNETEMSKREFQMVFGKPVYTINYKNEQSFVSIEGTSLARYRVNTLAEFKEDSAFLLRPEILIFINEQLAAFNKEIQSVDYDHMTPSQKQAAAQAAYKYIKRYKDKPGFKTPFYVVRLMKNQHVVCVFEQEIK